MLDLLIETNISLSKMNIKKLLLLILFFFSISFIAPKTSRAIDLQKILTSENSIVLKIQEGIEYFFAFKVENKVDVLEKQAEKRLVTAQNYAEDGNNEKVQNVLQNYLQIKEKQNNLLGKTNSGEVLGKVEESTIKQQETMEEIKTMVDEDGKQKVVKVQEQVVNQVAQRIVKVNGSEGQTKFFNKVEHVWAPGTGPGREAGTSFAPGTSGTGSGGVTIEGGGSQYAPGTSQGGKSGVVVEGGTIQFAPGTSGGGPAGSDIKNVEIKTGGGSDGGGKTVEGGNPGNTTGGNPTNSGNPVNTIDKGSVDPGGTVDSKNVIDP